MLRRLTIATLLTVGLTGAGFWAVHSAYEARLTERLAWEARKAAAHAADDWQQAFMHAQIHSLQNDMMRSRGRAVDRTMDTIEQDCRTILGPDDSAHLRTCTATFDGRGRLIRLVETPEITPQE